MSGRRVALTFLLLARSALAVEPEAAASFHAHVAPLLQRYCTDCHGAEKQKAKIDFTRARTTADLAAGSDLWYRVLDQLEAGQMPPKDEEQPAPAERAELIAWVRGDFTRLQLARQREEGRARLRRLTRTEYAWAMEDLFGVRPAVEMELPADGLADGYDKVSSALSLSAEGARGFMAMAEETMRWLWKAPGEEPRTVRAPAIESGESQGHSLVLRDGSIVSFNTDNTSGRIKFPQVRTPGRYHLRVSVYGYQTDKPLPFGVYVGRTDFYPQQIELAEILEAPPGKAAVLEADVELKENDGVRLIPFGLGVPVPKNSQASACRAPGLAVQWVEATAPELPLSVYHLLLADFPPALITEMHEMRRAHFGRDPASYPIRSVKRDECVAILRKTFRRVGARLWRRDLTAAEVADFTDETMRRMAEYDFPLESAFLSQIVEMLTAPEFLCVIERPGPLSDFALASRLSFFLWDSVPDEALLEVARQGHLHEPRVLAAQTDRLLKDPKSARFLADFTDQWLGLRAIADTSPDRQLYPGYDELLRFSSVRETRRFLGTLLAEDRGVRELVAARWSWLNQPLAEHYGVPGVTGLRLRQTDFPAGSPYGGLWTQSAILKVTANGTNTSPVKRGVFVSERLLGERIPPPPPGTKPLQPDVRGAHTLREQLAQHRQNPACAACHARFDPYGFVLESFDVTGAWRTHYRVPAGDKWQDGLPIDCTGETPAGQSFASLTDLRPLLAAEPRQLALGFLRHLVTYATGTPPTRVDEPALAAIADQTASAGYPLRSLLHSLVQSPLFRDK